MPYSESQFADLVAEKGGFDKKEAKAFLAALEEAVYSVVKQADKAKIPGLGTLNCNVREKRKARNPATGETFMAPAKIALRFSLEKPLKDSVPTIKKGRDLIEKREAAKSTTKKKSTGSKKVKTKEKASGAKRGPGRPPKSAGGAVKRGPGRPKGSGTKSAKSAKSETGAKRGRPKGSKKSKRRI